MSAARRIAFAAGAVMFAGGVTASAISCKHGDYDGSYDGSYDGGSSADGAVTFTHVVQPDKVETVAFPDGAFDVTFGSGTFSTAATITITSGAERTLESGLIVPTYLVTSDRTPLKVFQVSFRGNGNPGGATSARTLVAAVQAADTWKALAMVGTTNSGGSSATLWGLTTSTGTFSLAYITAGQQSAFLDTQSSCTAQCCRSANGGFVSGFAEGCYCAAGPALECFLAQKACGSLDSVAARCTEIAAGNTGTTECKPFPAPANCPGPGCMNYPGTCSPPPVGGGTNVCCVASGGSNATCQSAACTGFIARCSSDSACPAGTTCCVFDSESYCAKDCPAALRSCKSSADCPDAGADGGACPPTKCPISVCGTPPAPCQ